MRYALQLVLRSIGESARIERAIPDTLRTWRAQHAQPDNLTHISHSNSRAIKEDWSDEAFTYLVELLKGEWAVIKLAVFDPIFENALD